MAQDSSRTPLRGLELHGEDQQRFGLALYRSRHPRFSHPLSPSSPLYHLETTFTPTRLDPSTAVESSRSTRLRTLAEELELATSTEPLDSGSESHSSIEFPRSKINNKLSQSRKKTPAGKTPSNHRPSHPYSSFLAMTSLRVRPFSGGIDENVQQYINSVRSVFDLDNSASSTPFTPAIKAFYLSSNLEGKARKFISHLDSAIVDDWERLSKALLDKYRNNLEDEQARRQAVFKLYELKQGPKMKLRDYIKRARKIASSLPDSDEHRVVSKLIQCIYGKELRVHSTSSVPVTASMDEAIATI